MNLHLQKSKVKNQELQVTITGSKSETNRLLLLQALYPNLDITNISNSDDSEVTQKALTFTHHPSPITQTIDVHHAGTAMRFLTAFFSIQEGKEVLLTGSSRMKERPIKILVEALQQLGAEISYVENVGFPPIKIIGKKLSQNKVSLPANVSSQYISALLLIAPKLENGLVLTLEGEITSVPYIKMTLALLNEIGVQTSFENNTIKVNHQPSTINHQPITVESDWSSVSYWYSIVALSEIGTQITLSSYKKNSLQGDAALAEIYKDFGVETLFNENNTITISKEKAHNLLPLTQNLKDCPDIAQTISVTCFGLGIGCDLFGLHTLKIKETDRLEALKAELTKLGAEISVTNDSLHLQPSNSINENIAIKTYQDHRMAMAFAPLALRVPIVIEEAEVVSKSYPDFWNDLKAVGFQIA
ncbi:3-phosphoshikimate 1-carboxyvinyltransferase [Flavobacterium luminosum]|uniref:3-phosphoshikimate 1-carboxyvinyltransferase n=1 Tax=Flavobacterium luminosum TaxID=2949086 RepID=A0ABT0TQ27_9FLAO|nr:3-phosphoshikimate 1-carboxyvinyltransferase [Flavobacterium sp. HXWNR70]MCL9809386.1 3-phosphoshikimate 1-carboxyvinyltransferase [Flavobacterium sp. HXWNR70]